MHLEADKNAINLCLLILTHYNNHPSNDNELEQMNYFDIREIANGISNRTSLQIKLNQQRIEIFIQTQIF